MTRFAAISRFTALILISAVAAGPRVTLADSDSNPRPDDAPEDSAKYYVVKPNSGVVEFGQVKFEYSFGHLEKSDWGVVEVYPEALKKLVGSCPGYINVFIPAPASPAWVVENLYVEPATATDACSLEDPAKRKAREDSGESGPAGQQPDIPFTRNLDLRPRLDGIGPVSELHAGVVFTRQPLPRRLETLDFAYQKIEPAVFPVGQRVNNAEGGFVYLPSEEPLPLPDRDPTALIDIGPPPVEVNIPTGSTDLSSFPLVVSQSGNPNVNAAVNQCVPMAHANALGFLESKFDSEAILKWELMHSRGARGIGQQSAAGDVPYWGPAPSDSLVANVDAFTRREGVYDFESGEGSDGCQFFYGLFGYLSAYGDQAKGIFRHQGGAQTIDPTAFPYCAPAPFPLGGYTSQREGEEVTWEWVYDQLVRGRSVVASIAFVDLQGQRTGGHIMRIRGAERINGRDYFTFLDDSDQGFNFSGIRWPTYEVADRNQPGLAGVPNGRLELDGGNREITFAISMEAQPTLLIF